MATIRRRGDRWQGRVQSKEHGELSRSFTSQADAKVWCAITESEIARGTFAALKARVASETLTLTAALNRYQRQITSKKRGAFQEGKRIEAWQAWPVAAKPMHEIKPSDFAAWRDARLTHVQPATVARELAIVSHIYTVARQDWGAESLTNPVSGIKKPSQNNARTRTLAPVERAALLKACAPIVGTSGRVLAGNSVLHAVIRFVLETGMRRSEVLNLDWRHINIEECTARLPLTKNGTERVVPLSSKARAVLLEVGKKVEGRVFAITANQVHQGFVRAVARARRGYVSSGGCDLRVLSNLTFHDLRHTAITALAEKLPNVIELAAVSGHQDLRMLKRYFHPKASELALKLG